MFNATALKDAFNSKGGLTLLPSEFLIDEHGTLVDVLRANKVAEHMAMERIKCFMILGRRHPSAGKIEKSLIQRSESV